MSLSGQRAKLKAWLQANSLSLAPVPFSLLLTFLQTEVSGPSVMRENCVKFLALDKAHAMPELLWAFQGDPEQEAEAAALVGSLHINLM